MNPQQAPRGGKTKGSVRLLKFPTTDLGNAERFVATHRDRVRFCPPRRMWLTWNGTRWAWDETGEVVRLAKQTVRDIYKEVSACKDPDERQSLARHAARSENASRLAAMLELAKTEAGIPVLPSDLDANPWLLNCRNGTVDLTSGTRRGHDRADLITRCAAADFDPSATSELWEQCLADSTGGDSDLVSYLQRILGYALTGCASEKAFFFFHGPPDTSKSTIIGAWDHALGDYAASASFDTWCQRRDVGGNRGDLVQLMGARLVSSVEVRQGAKFDEQLLKSVTGGDTIVAAAKYEGEVSFAASFTLVLAANDAPRIRDDDAGMWSRVQRVPFVSVIADPDPTFRAKLCDDEVAAAVLAWGVKGCLEWQEHGLRPPACVTKSTAAYRAEGDRFAGFADEVIEVVRHQDLTGEVVVDTKGVSLGRTQVRKLYERWAEDEGVRFPLDAKDLASRLRELGAVDGKSNGIRVWKGVQLRDRDTGSRQDTYSGNYPHEE